MHQKPKSPLAVRSEVQKERFAVQTQISKAGDGATVTFLLIEEVGGKRRELPEQAMVLHSPFPPDSKELAKVIRVGSRRMQVRIKAMARKRRAPAVETW